MSDDTSHRPVLGRAKAGLLLLVGMVIGALLTALVPVVGRRLQDQPPQLLIASGVEEGQADARQALVDLWNESHRGKRAAIVNVRGSADEQLSTMERYARGEEPVKVDVVNLDLTAIAQFAEFGYITEWPASDVPEALLAQFLEGPRLSCYYEEKLWALPLNTDAGVLFSRRSLLAQPATKTPAAYAWKDIAAVGKNLPRKSSGAKAAYAGQLDDYEGLTVNALEAIWAVEQEMAQAGKPPAPSPPLGVPTDPAVWKAAVDRLYGPPGQGTVVDPGSRKYRERDTTARFLQDKIVFMRNWPVEFRALLDGSDQRNTIAAADIAMTGLPGPAVLGGQNLAVVKGSARAADARELIEFLASEPSQRLLMQVGGFAAATTSTYDRVEIQQAHPYAKTVQAAVLKSRQRPQTPYYPQFSEAVRELVQEIRNKGKVPPDLAQRLTNAAQGRLTPR